MCFCTVPCAGLTPLTSDYIWLDLEQTTAKRTTTFVTLLDLSRQQLEDQGRGPDADWEAPLWYHET